MKLEHTGLDNQDKPEELFKVRKFHTSAPCLRRHLTHIWTYRARSQML